MCEQQTGGQLAAFSRNYGKCCHPISVVKGIYPDANRDYGSRIFTEYPDVRGIAPDVEILTRGRVRNSQAEN